MWKYLLPLLLLACQGKTVPSDHTDDNDQEEEPWCENHEWEPNDEFFQSDYITVLPTFNETCVEGLISAEEEDIFEFFLVPPYPVTTMDVFFSLEVLSEYTTPKITLYQEDKSDGGGTFIRVGEFVGEPGYLLIDGWPVLYDHIKFNDVYVVVEAFAPPGVVTEYKLNTWSH